MLMSFTLCVIHTSLTVHPGGQQDYHPWVIYSQVNNVLIKEDRMGQFVHKVAKVHKGGHKLCFQRTYHLEK